MKTLWILISFSAVFISYNDVFHPFWLEGKVIEVSDGDSALIEYSGRHINLRLKFIDAPELDQIPIGKLSKSYLNQLIINKKVRVRVLGKGFYGRYLGEIYRNSESINLKMVEEGFAFIYKFSTFPNIKMKINYFTAYKLAKLQRRGVWKYPNLVNPFHFRKKKRQKKRASKRGPI